MIQIFSRYQEFSLPVSTISCQFPLSDCHLRYGFQILQSQAQMRNSHFHGEEPQQRVFFTDPRRLLFYPEEVGNLNDACSIKKGMVFFWCSFAIICKSRKPQGDFCLARNKKGQPPGVLFPKCFVFCCCGNREGKGFIEYLQEITNGSW